ncbi:hypothetical protein DPEC_G00359690 [Dallia pectoralis]|uniref:Uncharacterized protein n=1 Tax=Dallia pectoralis TaxID=75939 RepID=A0ACC2F0P2_DALPE|nr:hypothetical protein DPEC_G00359690 [Dallia pectoralis]
MNSLLVVALLLCVTLGRKTSSDVIAPQGVKFVSMDYINILHWKQHAKSNYNQKYYVQWKVYGEKHWTNAENCQGIRRLLCDLSLETSDPREWYYARVLAARSGLQSPWVLTRRFNPKWETSVSPPVVKLNVTREGVLVQLRPPRSPLTRRNGNWISVRKLQRMTYAIYVMQNDVEQKTMEIKSCAKRFLLSDLKPRTTYCLQAETRLYLLDRRSPLSPKACVTTL